MFFPHTYPTKVRSVVELVPKSNRSKPKILPQALLLDSGANIHIFNNPSFLLDTNNDIARAVKITASRVVCLIKLDVVVTPLKSSLPMTGYYFQPNGIENLIDLSLLSDNHRIVMDTAVENAFYVFAEDRTYTKFTQYKARNLHTHVV